MTFRIKGPSRGHKVRFPKAMEASSSEASVPSFTNIEPPSKDQREFVIEELPSSEAGEDMWEDEPIEETSRAAQPFIPDLYTSWPPIQDILNTESSYVQNDTILESLPYLNGTCGEFDFYNHHGIPHLDRTRHIRFLHKSLQNLPSGYVASDAARPWFFYWALCGLKTLGEDVSIYRERLISSVQPMQNPNGGFGGGHGQMSHLAPTYAILLALSMVGGEEALEIVDRKAMWRWLGSIKQPDGGFQVCLGGEEDVRGAYCAAVVICLLNLPLELPPDSPASDCDMMTLLTGLPEYVRRCQTYEGGISGMPDSEAHGAYAFCGLACLCILGDPHVMIPKYLNVPALISWLSSRQYAPEGGFSGRTNKLVDGCYSFWVGGCWPLMNATLNPPTTSVKGEQRSLFDREGLIRYILCACQDTSRRGGMRDKPSKNSDPYHTCYVLAGLSCTQHSSNFSLDTNTEISDINSDLSSAFRWVVNGDHPQLKAESITGVEEEKEQEIYDGVDKVGSLHPIFAIPASAAESTRRYFEGKGGFV